MKMITMGDPLMCYLLSAVSFMIKTQNVLAIKQEGQDKLFGSFSNKI